MTNQAIIIGRLRYVYETNNIIEIICNQQESDITIIPVELSKNLLDHMKEYCKINDLIAVKGHLKNKDNNLILFADKITFLSSSSSSNLEGGESNDSEQLS